MTETELEECRECHKMLHPELLMVGRCVQCHNDKRVKVACYALNHRITDCWKCGEPIPADTTNSICAECLQGLQ